MDIPLSARVRIALAGIVLIGVIVTNGRTDITNGSFEINGQPSLEGWETASAQSYQDAPSGGGSWCVRLQGGCVHGVCWQVDGDVRDGEVWRVSCWMRRDVETPYGWGTLGWRVMTQDGWRDGNAVGCNSTDWTFLSVTDTFSLDEGDTAVVFMDGGGGIAGPGMVYFDLVETEIVEALCGDCNGDGRITVADASYIIGYIHRSGQEPIGEADVNVDGRVTVADANYIVSYSYRSGPEPCNP